MKIWGMEFDQRFVLAMFWSSVSAFVLIYGYIKGDEKLKDHIITFVETGIMFAIMGLYFRSQENKNESNN